MMHLWRVMIMSGLGKPRTPLGEWVDRYLRSQVEFMNICGLDKNTTTRICGDISHKPNGSTRRRVIFGLAKKGFQVEEKQFWPDL
jgi:hypothetical protein